MDNLPVTVRYAMELLGAELVGEYQEDDLGETEYCCELMWSYIQMRNGRVDLCETKEDFAQLEQDSGHAELCRKIRDHKCNPEAWAIYAEAMRVGNEQIARFAEDELMQVSHDR